MVHNLVNREKEMKFLEGKFSQKGAQMVVIYGRRRVGKTFLLQHFVKNKGHVYYLCSKDNEQEQIRMISKKFGELFKDAALQLNPFSRWDDLFVYLHGKIGDKKIVFVMDEFPFLTSANNAVVSILQKYWDEYLSKTGIYLVLCGSSISMMERETLSYKSPIYGRRTGQWKINPFDFADFTKLFDKKTPLEDIVKYYSIIGGIPFYFEKLDARKTIWENIFKSIFKKGEVLYDEGESLLKQELNEPYTYMAILKAVASGSSKQSEIANSINMASTSISRYLTTLIGLDILEKSVSLTDKANSKKSIYSIKDNFFRFWFKFVYPNRSYIEEENMQKLKAILDVDFNSFVGRAFENICGQIIKNLKLPIDPTKTGRWWFKDKEIDLVCLDENKKEALFIECKWSDLKEKEARKVLEDLKKKSVSVDWKRTKEYFGLIGKKVVGKESLKKEGFVVFDLEDFEKVLN